MRPVGLYLAVCDEQSPMHTPSLASNAWHSTTRGSDIRLFQFNGYFVDRMRAEQGIAWILVLWGTFRLRVVLHSPDSTQFPFTGLAPLIGNEYEAVITCKTGRLVWVDVEREDGLGSRHVAEVPPGRYNCVLTGEEGHWEIEDPAHYPEGDEDWTLHMQAI